MLAEKIRTLLGPELTTQVEEKLKGKGKDDKDVDIVVGNDGSFLPSDKADTLRAEKVAAETLATNAVAQLQALKDTGDPEKLKADLLKAQGELATLQTSHAKEVTDIRKKGAIALKLVDTFYDPADAVDRIDLDKVVMNAKGEITGGLDDQITEIKTQKPHWVKPGKDDDDETDPTVSGFKPAAKPLPSASNNPWKKETFNLTEQGRITKSNPALAAKLKAQAGK